MIIVELVYYSEKRFPALLLSYMNETKTFRTWHSLLYNFTVGSLFLCNSPADLVMSIQY